MYTVLFLVFLCRYDTAILYIDPLSIPIHFGTYKVYNLYTAGFTLIIQR